MRRKEDPAKTCGFIGCRKPLVRKRYSWGLEDHVRFLQRRFCDRECGVRGRKNRQRSDLVRFMVRLRPDEIVNLRIVAGRNHHGDLDRAIGALATAAATQ